MSAEGQTYVEKYSPYRGNAYQVHLRLGLLSNDAHGFQIYCGDKYLADMCRCSQKTVQRVREQLVADGFLRVLSPAEGRRTAVYEFIFKGLAIGGQFDQPSEGIGGHFVPNRWTSEKTSPITTNKYKQSEKPSNRQQSEAVPMPEGFKESLGFLRIAQN